MMMLMCCATLQATVSENSVCALPVTAVLQMQLVKRLARAPSALVGVLAQLEELWTEPMAHAARAMSAWAELLSKPVELHLELVVHSARTMLAWAEVLSQLEKLQLESMV
jgi:hypothetical protein